MVHAVKTIYKCNKCDFGICTAHNPTAGLTRLNEFDCVSGTCPGKMVATEGTNQQLRAGFRWMRHTKGALRRLRKRKDRATLAYYAQGGARLVPWKRQMSGGAIAAVNKFTGEKPAVLGDTEPATYTP